jgi:Flp pilus assembly pilin Flp
LRIDLANKKGASLLEYGMLAGLIAVVSIASVSMVGDEVRQTFSTSSETLSTSRSGAVGQSEETSWDSGLLVNGDAESGLNGWSGAPWAVGTDGTQTWFERPGSECCDQMFQTVVLTASQIADVAGGASVVDIRFDGKQAGTEQGPRLELRYYDSSGPMITFWDSGGEDSTIPALGEWHTYDVSAGVPANTKRIEVHLRSAANAAQHYDNIYMNIRTP